MKHLLIIGILAALAGCGAEGTPFETHGKSTISIGTHTGGLRSRTEVETTNGAFTLGVGLDR